jgi:cysteine desulfurase
MHLVRLKDNGHVDLDHLQELLNTLPNCMVSLMHANNEIGNLLDIETVGNMAHQAGALFHCDTVQTMGHYPFDLSKGHIDYLAAAAHKFNGPKGVGFIYMNKAHRLPPQITGGAQEREVRGGTENVYGIIGMAKALEICYRDMEKKRSHIEHLKKCMMELLENEIPGVAFNGDCKGNCLYTVLSVSFPASEAGNMLLFNLDISGISASGGSACSSGSNKGSHVISAINPGTDRTTVRFSFGKFNTEEEIRATVEKLKTWYPAAVQA